MKLAYAVIIEDRHFDTQVEVFQEASDAILRGHELAEKESEHHNLATIQDANMELVDDLLFNFCIEDGISICVRPTTIYESGEQPSE